MVQSDAGVVEVTSYYNEFDPKAAAWLRELIKAGLIPGGDVDERSITEVQPDDLKGYVQCHFFAGIAGWPYALQLAGWPPDRPVWTGSCPCQPFSTAGKGKGTDDERHLWPVFGNLIKECRPPICFGEQVAGKAGAAWFAIVQADMEREDYACGVVVFPACGVGAPHQRQRQYWFAEDAEGKRECTDESGQDSRNRKGLEYTTDIGCVGSSRSDKESLNARWAKEPNDNGDSSEGRPSASSMEDSGQGRARNNTGTFGEQGRHTVDGRPECLRQGHGKTLPDGSDTDGTIDSLADTTNDGHSTGDGLREEAEPSEQTGAQCLGESTRSCNDSNPCPTNGHWREADWLFCRDGKWRPVEPSLKPLVNGAPERVGRLRGYGNAIVAQQAQAFIESYMDATHDV